MMAKAGKHKSYRIDLRRLDVDQILKLIESHRIRTGRFPVAGSGRVHDVPRLTWHRINKALWQQTLEQGGVTLADLIHEHFGRRPQRGKRTLTVDRVMRWAEAHRKRHGRWPNHLSGPVPEEPGLRWHSVVAAMQKGLMGLPAKTLARHIVERHGEVMRNHQPRLTPEQVLRWADAHHKRTGRWPSKDRGGRVHKSPSESWAAIDAAINRGLRGLPRLGSLARLLEKHRGYNNIGNRPRLSETKILRWADDHKRRTGGWPTQYSGVVLAAPENTWNQIHHALLRGMRGLSAGTTLSKLLHDRRGKPSQPYQPKLTLTKIRQWAREHRRRTGRWPRACDGKVFGQRHEYWSRINKALLDGYRGLPGGTNLAKMFGNQHRTG